MATTASGISTIYEAWSDVAGLSTRPSFPIEYSAYTDDRCIINDDTLLSTCQVSIVEEPSVIYSTEHNQAVKYIDLKKAESHPIPSGGYFHFTAINNTTISYSTHKSHELHPDLQYSIDGCKTWKQWDECINLTPNETVYFSGDSLNKFNPGTQEILWWHFVISDDVSVGGDIHSIGGPNYPYACYNLFSGCNIVDASNLILGDEVGFHSYEGMFNDCTILTTAPELPAIILSESCYEGMFKNCMSLTTAPELPAVNLSENCYRYMFSGCTSLNNIKIHFTSYGSNNNKYTRNWVYGVSKSGKFEKYYDSPNVVDDSNIPSGWSISNYTYNNINDYMHFTALENNCTIRLSAVNKILDANKTSIEYSINSGNTWYTFTNTGGTRETISLNCDTTIYLRGNNNYINDFVSESYNYFEISGKLSGGGSIMSIINAQYKLCNVTNYCFKNIFKNCQSLISAPELTAKEVDVHSYANMFLNCTNLSYIKCLSQEVDDKYTTDWVSGVSPTNIGYFVAIPSLKYSWEECEENCGIPNGFIYLSVSPYDK